ncbi:MAG: hypothetical protein ACP5NV_06650 [Candidatus Woesearchaeota archaeon]
MFKKLSKKYHSSNFKKSLLAVKNNPLLILYIVLLDAAFFAIFYLLNLVLNKFIPENPEIALAASGQAVFFLIMLLLSVLYFVIIIVAYSFFNLIILGNIRKMSSKYSHNISMFKEMFFLNLILFILFFILLTLFNFMTTLIVNKSIWLASIVFVVMFVILVLAYAFHNFSHSTFILGNDLKKTLAASLKSVISKSYFGIIIFSFVIMALYFCVYLLLGLFIDDFIVSNYDTFINTSSILTLIVVYILFTFNRVYFFFVAEKNIGKAQ